MFKHRQRSNTYNTERMDLSFLEQDDLIAEFQDLIDLDDEIAFETGPFDTDSIDIHKLDANSLTLTDIIVELERRGIQPKGFYCDDAKRLQRCFDDEQEQYVQTKKKELCDAKIAEAELKRERFKKTLIENEVMEEKHELSSNPRLSEWFRLIVSKRCPYDIRIDVNNISTRSLAKALWSDTRIKTVDLSNLGLSDRTGAYLGRALRKNTSLRKLELDGNLFGPETIKSLANSLPDNKTLTSLSIGSNPLMVKSDESDYIEQLGIAIANNTSLVYLSLWRCGIGQAGGKSICNAVSKNTNLITFEIGYNDFDLKDILLMSNQLEANRRARELQNSHDVELAERQERVFQEQLKAKQEKEEEEKIRQWLEEQKDSRARSRLLELEQRNDKEKKDNEKQQQMERIQKLEEERVMAASKKGKKGKKKGKKK